MSVTKAGIKTYSEQRKEMVNRKIKDKDIIEEHLLELEAATMQKVLRDDDFEMLKKEYNLLYFEDRLLKKELSIATQTLSEMKDEIGWRTFKIDELNRKNNDKDKELKELRGIVDRLNKYDRFEVMDLDDD